MTHLHFLPCLCLPRELMAGTIAILRSLSPYCLHSCVCTENDFLVDDPANAWLASGMITAGSMLLLFLATLSIYRTEVAQFFSFAAEHPHTKLQLTCIKTLSWSCIFAVIICPLYYAGSAYFEVSYIWTCYTLADSPSCCSVGAAYEQFQLCIWRTAPWLRTALPVLSASSLLWPAMQW